MRKWILLFVFTLSSFASGWAKEATLSDVMEKLPEHPYVKEKKYQAEKSFAEGKEKGSWGDPRLGVTAQRVPLESLSLSEHQRTELMASLSQKLSFSGHHSKLEESYKYRAKGMEFSAEDRLRRLRAMTWKTFVQRKSLKEQEKILRENLEWLKDMIKVSQNLYTNGTIGQQNLFDLETRKAEVESQILDIESKISQNVQEINYLSNTSVNSVSLRDADWKKLNSLSRKGDRDFKEKRLKKEVQASELAIQSKRQNLIPDPTLSVNYMRMNNNPNLQNMVGVSLSFPLPFSGEKYARIDKEVRQKRVAENQYRNYKSEKRSVLRKIAAAVGSLSNRLKILRQRSLKFAESSREVTARAYQRGNVTYKELQTSELKLQELNIQQQKLWAKLQEKRVDYAYLSGGTLYE